MSDESVPLTRQGYEVLTAELERLKRFDRHEVIGEIEVARAHGDLRENAEYHAAKEKQGFIEGRIADLEDKLARARVIEYTNNEDDNKVRFGAFVKVIDEDSGEEKTYRIVGDLEADIHKFKISLSSPLARALLGKEVGDAVEVRAPKGVIGYSIMGIHY